MLIGREKEQALLRELLRSKQSEFVALYGRRRVGKTFLVRETFNYQFAFQHTGILDATMNEQLTEFRESLYAAGLPKSPKPKNWGDAFRLLQRLLADLPEGKKVFYIYTHGAPKGNFLKGIREIAEEKHCREIGEYRCQGFDTFGPFKLIGGLAKGHPTEEEIRGAAEFYRQMEGTEQEV